MRWVQFVKGYSSVTDAHDKIPMAEATKIVLTLDDAVQAYRGEDRFCKAFDIYAGALKRWRGIGCLGHMRSASTSAYVRGVATLALSCSANFSQRTDRRSRSLEASGPHARAPYLKGLDLAFKR